MLIFKIIFKILSLIEFREEVSIGRVVNASQELSPTFLSHHVGAGLASNQQMRRNELLLRSRVSQ